MAMDADVDPEKLLKELVAETGISEAEAREILFGPAQPREMSAEEYNLNFLAESFPDISEGVRKSTLEAHNNDLDKATEHLLNYDALRTAKGDDPQYFVRQQKKALKGAHKNAKAQSKQEANEEAAVQAIAEVLKTNDERARELYNTWDHNVSMAIMHGSAHLINARSVDRLLSTFGYSTMQEPEKGAVPTSSKQWEGYSVRDLAREVRSAQSVLITESERAARYSRQKNEKRAIATDAAERAYIARQRLRDLDIELASRSQDYQAFRGVLDLHGLDSRTAERVILRHLKELAQVLNSDKPGELEIITGAGIHSQDGVPVLKNLARNILDDNRWKYTELPGSFVVTRRL